MSVPEAILDHANVAGGAIFGPKSFLHLGSRAAVDKALSRLTEAGLLLRVGRGRYVRPKSSRFGARPPSAEEAVEQIAKATGEVLVPSGAAEAHRLGLTTQVPIRRVYLTSGRSRRLHLGKQGVELRAAPAWQLTGPGTREGAVLRAVEWLGPEAPRETAAKAVAMLTEEERRRLISTCASAPAWLAKRLGEALYPSHAAA